MIEHDVINRSYDEAKSMADSANMKIRIGRKDAEQYLLTMDYDENRVTVELDNGIITSAKMG